ncbi:phospholipid phosphatase [Bacteroidia bacterium]|nr:phospholipid phosphatase [Bacteroidia bacterium]
MKYVPALLVVVCVLRGTLGYGQINYPLSKFDRYIDKQVSQNYNGKTSVDNYIQYAPAVAVYGLDLAGVKAKHNFRDRTFVMASSYLLMAVTVNTLKYTVNVRRPDSSAENSFPSGHTATAFTGAHILFREYKDTSPWIGIAGYATATATGALRILNRRHWVSDVVVGAGTGILCAEAGYLLLPVFHRVVGIPNTLVIAPMVGNNTYGAGLAYTF